MISRTTFQLLFVSSTGFFRLSVSRGSDEWCWLAYVDWQTALALVSVVGNANRFSPDLESIKPSKVETIQASEVTDVGPAYWCLGLQTAHSEDGVFMPQGLYISSSFASWLLRTQRRR
jgi:hypothetical protein